MAVGSRPLSNEPEAVRKRRQRENDKLAAKAAELAARITLPAVATAPSSPPPSSPTPANTNAPIPLHETQPVSAAGADAYAVVPELAPRTEGGEPTPLVPETPQVLGADGRPIAAPTNGRRPITPEEAKMFGALVVTYFQFGSQQLLNKHPEFAEAAVGMSGGPEQFQKAFGVGCAFLQQAGERVALKYNLYIPYMDEAIVLAAIGVATFGLAGKPSERGKAILDEQARVKNAKNANPSPPPKPGEKAPPPDDIVKDTL